MKQRPGVAHLKNSSVNEGNRKTFQDDVKDDGDDDGEDVFSVETEERRRDKRCGTGKSRRSCPCFWTSRKKDQMASSNPGNGNGQLLL